MITSSIKKKVFISFLFLLGLIISVKVFISELYFLTKLLFISLSAKLLLQAIYDIAKKTANRGVMVKKSLIFILFSLSFFAFLSTLSVSGLDSYFEYTETGGVVLFVIYVVFFKLFKLDSNLNSTFALISLCLIPVYALGNFTYGAETFAVFAFLTLILSVYYLIMEARRTHENI